MNTLKAFSNNFWIKSKISWTLFLTKLSGYITLVTISKLTNSLLIVKKESKLSLKAYLSIRLKKELLMRLLTKNAWFTSSNLSLLRSKKILIFFLQKNNRTPKTLKIRMLSKPLVVYSNSVLTPKKKSRWLLVKEMVIQIENGVASLLIHLMTFIWRFSNNLSLTIWIRHIKL